MAGLPPPASSDPNAEDGEVPPLSKQAKLSVMALFIMIFLDMIGYMALMPTLIFYVREVGGSESQYGTIMAGSSFGSFLMMPLYASWVDASGKFRKPWFVGQCMCIIGMFLYTFAIIFVQTGLAVHVLLASRIIYGIGAASGSISFTYIASMIEPSQLTFVTMLLSLASGQGMAWGPFLNSFLEDVDFTINLFGLTIPVNDINGVGILISLIQSINLFLIYFFLPEPPSKKREEETIMIEKAKLIQDEPEQENAGWNAVIQELTTDIKLFLPLFTLFVVNANYQLIEISFPPATSHALGWGPSETSAVFGYNTILMGLVMFGAMKLSQQYNLSDTSMIIAGNTFWVIAGFMMVRAGKKDQLARERNHSLIYYCAASCLVLFVVFICYPSSQCI